MLFLKKFILLSVEPSLSSAERLIVRLVASAYPYTLVELIVEYFRIIAI